MAAVVAGVVALREHITTDTGLLVVALLGAVVTAAGIVVVSRRGARMLEAHVGHDQDATVATWG